ncbi:MAG TPA: hypothetical protein VF043_10765 [Ktedonobacteraceae bacterium]
MRSKHLNSHSIRKVQNIAAPRISQLKRGALVDGKQASVLYPAA